MELFLPYLLFASPEMETCCRDGFEGRIMMFDKGNFDRELCTYLSNMLRFHSYHTWKLHADAKAKRETSALQVVLGVALKALEVVRRYRFSLAP